MKPHIEFIHILQTWHVSCPLVEGYGRTMTEAWDDYTKTLQQEIERLEQYRQNSFLTALPEFPISDYQLKGERTRK